MDKLWATESHQKQLRRQLEKKIKINDIVSMILGMFGLILAYFEVEEFYGELEWKTVDKELFFNIVKKQYKETSDIITMRVFIGISSALLAISVLNHYNLLLKLQKLQQRVETTDTLRSSGLLWWMLAEFVYSLIHCPPSCNWVYKFEQYGGDLEYSFDEITFIVMLGRIYLIWRIFINHSSWNDERADEICRNCLCEGGVSFAIKAEFKERPYLVVSLVLFASIFSFGIALRNAERPFKYHSGQDWDSIWNGMWCIIITMTTVGFGDFYATTHLGRIIGVLACFWGTFLVSLMVVSLSISSELTPRERKAYIKIKKDEAVHKIECKAIDAIKFSLKLWIFLKRNPKANDSHISRSTNQFKSALIDYRAEKRNLIASKQDTSIDYILYKLNDKVAFGLDKIKNDCMVYKSLLIRLDNAEENQLKLQEDIQRLAELNKDIVEKLKKIKGIRVKETKSIEPRAIENRVSDSRSTELSEYISTELYESRSTIEAQAYEARSIYKKIY